MPDDSILDKKYFINNHIYNCPLCNRRNVAYFITDYYDFDWTDSKKCHVYFAQCLSCEKKSMHLSYTEIELISIGQHPGSRPYRFRERQIDDHDLDELFFYSVPTSFFSINNKIPKILREIFTEAEGCLKSNFLTGASACARKIVYELASLEKASGENYDDRIRSLKSIKKNIDPTYFDTLLTIQQITSNKVHENAYDKWEAKHIRLILASLMEILNEIYVIPKLREEKRKQILELKESILNKQNSKAPAVDSLEKTKIEINDT